MTLALPTYDDVAAAAARIAGHAHRTPVLVSRTADAELGARLFFKCENFQRMGAFKFRGAYNALARFDARQRRAGVVAFSSGNHAQAISLAATLIGMPAVIVMPHDAPAAKVAATKGYGAQTLHLGELTFPIICRDVADIFTASDAELVAAMRFFAERMKMVVEPTGALGYAAARRMKSELAGQRVGVIISGGNVDLTRL